MIDDYDFFFHKIDSNFGDLFFGWLLGIFFKLPGHFLNADFTDMVIIIVGVFCCIDFIFVGFDECDTLGHKPIVPVDIKFNGLFPDLFDTLDQTVRVSVGVEIDDSHASVNLCEFLPVRHFARAIIFYGFKIVWIAVFSLELVTAVLVEVPNFADFYLFVVLFDEKLFTSYWVYFMTSPSGWL